MEPSALSPASTKSNEVSGWVEGFTWQPVAEHWQGECRVGR
jgi:hypothetical protein